MKEQLYSFYSIFLNRKHFLIAFFLIFFMGLFSSQTQNVPSSGNSTFTTCSGTLYDRGGSAGNYSNNSNGYTIVTPSIAGNMIRISSTNIDIEGSDRLIIYDGTTITGTILWQSSTSGNNCGTQTVPEITSLTGSLTVRFTSNNNKVCSGFALPISCIPPCVGTPSSATVSLSASTGAPSSTFTTSSSGGTVATGLTYQWESAPTSTGPWSAIAGATSKTSTITAVNTFNITTYYRLVTTCSANPLLPAYSNVVSFYTDYCSANVSTPTDLYINEFQFVGVLNDPPANVQTGTSAYSNGYQNYTSFTPIGKQPQNSAINVAAKTNIVNGGTWKAWVDWNRDGDFNDTVDGKSEEVYKMITFTTPSVTFGFIPPSSALGTYRLRIATYSVGNRDYNSCGVLSNGDPFVGEYEDYLFEIVADCAAKVLTVNTVNQYDGERCGAGSVRISATGNASAVNYRWYDSVYDGNFLGTGNTFLTPSISNTTTYYVTAVSSGGCETPFRYPVDARIDPNPTVRFINNDPPICGEDVPSALVTATGDKYQDVIFEDFSNGLGVFNNDSTESVYINTNAEWLIKSSNYIPSVNPYEGTAPAFSSGYFGGNYAIINSDINRDFDIKYHLYSNNLDVSSFLDLYVDFDMYHFSIAKAADYSEGYVAVEYSLDGGSTWQLVTKFINDVGNPFEWKKFKKIQIPNQLDGNGNPIAFTQTNFKLRFTHFSHAITNKFYEAITTLDNVRIYGFKAINTPFTWGSSTTNLYDADCVTPLGSNQRSTVCVKPNPTQLEQTNWTLNANATFSNGCPAVGSVVVDNDTKTWIHASNDWNVGANWKPVNVPNIDKCVIVRTPLEIGVNGNIDGFARSVIVKSGGNLNIKPNSSLTVKNHVKNQSVAGDFIVQSDANLLQINDDATNEGSITVKRNANLKRLDYNYWGSPVSGRNLGSFSPSTLTSRFYVYREKDDYFDGVFSYSSYTGFTIADAFPLKDRSTYNFEIGKGYAVRAPNNFTTTVANFEGVFVGEANNGLKTVAVTKNGGGYNLISNPYPSNIDFEKFYDENDLILDKVAYFWTNTNFNPEMQANQYPKAGIINNYAVYTGTGGLAAPYGFTGAGNNTPVGESGNCPTCQTPNQYIKVGQGFVVKATSAGTLRFYNAIRDKNTSSKFFNRTANVSKDRYWLELKTPLNFVTPLLVGYVAGATDGFENDYDAPLLSQGADTFYTILDNKKLAVQGKQFPLKINDVVKLGAIFYDAGIHTVSLSNKEGIFSSNQSIYLHDKKENIYTDLKKSTYSFFAEKGENVERFEIVYQVEETLGTNDLTKKDLLVYKNQDNYEVLSSEVIQVISMYDASGKLLLEVKPNAKNYILHSERLVKGIYLLKIITNQGEHIKKIFK